MSPRHAVVARAVAALVTLSALAAPALAKPGTLLVVNKADNTATVLDRESGATLMTIATSTGPHEGAISPDGNLAAIAEYGAQAPGNTLRVVDLSTGKEVSRIDLGRFTRPHGIAFTPDGARLVVTSETTQRVVVVDVATSAVVADIPTDAQGSHVLALSADGRRVYTSNVGSGSVSVIDLEQRALVATVPTSAQVEAIALSPDGRHLWVGSRSRHVLEAVDTESLEVVATVECPGMPFRLAFTPDGAWLLATCAQSGDVAVIDAKARTLSHRVALGLPEARRTALDPTPPGMAPIVPLGIAVTSDSRTAFVTIANGACVAEIDLKSRRVVRCLDAGRGPDGIAVTDRVHAKG